MFSRYRILAVVMATVLVTACAPTMVRNVTDAPVVSNKASLTLDDVRVAITRAGTGLGWIMIEERPGLIKGTLKLRSHEAIVDVTYDTSAYSIQYADSTNLNYNESKGTIHKNYNGWIQNLENAIERELSALM
ncbi:MAG: hypothetical protein AMJ66_01540 [Betaproteobacteria bacterium SG8_40]|nr:MAG: hypothetical protein AMJ66_01540 [Betaproteobacteria bacterium SG8_40]